MMRRLLGKIDEGETHLAPKYVDVYGDTAVSPNADPWIVREGDCYVTNYNANGRLREEYSYKFVRQESGVTQDEGFTWGGMLKEAMHRSGDDGPVLACSVAEADMAKRDHEVAPHFSAWTPTRVYFPVKYDGGVWVESAPREPSAEQLYPVGGG